MKSLILTLTAAAAVLGLAACGGHAAQAPAAAPASPAATPAASAAATPLTCKQQDAQWKAANKGTIRKFKRALTPFEGGTVTSAQASRLSSAAQAMDAIPLPACADPKGYYGQAMANLATAGTAASSGGALSELGALTPMENALTALTELSAELKQTTGSGKI